MNDSALIIMAKYPDPDTVKTRLSGSMSPQERVGLYEKLLHNTISRLSGLSGIDTIINYTPYNADSYFKMFGSDVFPQVEGDIGERMFRAIEEVIGRGYGKTVLVGVDIPDLTGGIVENAFSMLEHNDLVFGPALDGGYYLIGMKKPLEAIFRDIQWSSPHTLQQTIVVAESLGRTIAYTEYLQDVDTIEDVHNKGLI
ncbi:MAG: TIGR04282 family arsenosugar biosynthesis glycosyltransferase [Nitrospirota bacterium]|nr:MAG: TIGR04282 family arsenosugar biosynthesis glycosyltransferase [Nitrospirota bacterium]